MTTIHKHEMMGVNYLLKNGYNIEDIKINSGGIALTPSGTPDISTTDGQQFEVKRVISEVLEFTAAQVHMNDDTNILVFNNDRRFVDNIKFGKILRDETKYKARFKINMDVHTALSYTNKCDYTNALTRFGLNHKRSRTFDYLNFLNVEVSTDTRLLDDDDDDGSGTYMKLTDKGGSRIEYYVNGEIVGSTNNNLFGGDTFTIRTSGTARTNTLIYWLKYASNTPNKYGDKRDVYIFDGIGINHDKPIVFNTVCFINDIYVADLSHGDNLTIKTIGGSEYNTIKQCFNFASIELEHQMIVNSMRLIYKRQRYYEMGPDYMSVEYSELYNKYIEVMHKLLDIELQDDEQLSRLIYNEIEKE